MVWTDKYRWCGGISWPIMYFRCWLSRLIFIQFVTNHNRRSCLLRRMYPAIFRLQGKLLLSTHLLRESSVRYLYVIQYLLSSQFLISPISSDRLATRKNQLIINLVFFGRRGHIQHHVHSILHLWMTVNSKTTLMCGQIHTIHLLNTCSEKQLALSPIMALSTGLVW
jgi:hypothetical protein